VSSIEFVDELLLRSNSSWEPTGPIHDLDSTVAAPLEHPTRIAAIAARQPQPDPSLPHRPITPADECVYTHYTGGGVSELVSE